MGFFIIHINASVLYFYIETELPTDVAQACNSCRVAVRNKRVHFSKLF